MCGRFVREVNTEEIAAEFGAAPPGFELGASYNIAPSARVAVVVGDEDGRPGLRVVPCTWGFVPHWARDPSVGYKMINARAETLAEKPSFRRAFAGHRCLVVATGFYEWMRDGGKKTPVFIRLKERRAFGFAGLYGYWRTDEGATLCTCTIVTVEANEALGPVHDRMPAILSRKDERLWLSADASAGELQGILKPYPSDGVEFFEVSRSVNSPANDSPVNIRPV